MGITFFKVDDYLNVLPLSAVSPELFSRIFVVKELIEMT